LAVANFIPFIAENKRAQIHFLRRLKKYNDKTYIIGLIGVEIKRQYVKERVEYVHEIRQYIGGQNWSNYLGGITCKVIYSEYFLWKLGNVRNI